jgi:hypothetical protein
MFELCFDPNSYPQGGSGVFKVHVDEEVKKFLPRRLSKEGVESQAAASRFPKQPDIGIFP